MAKAPERTKTQRVVLYMRPELGEDVVSLAKEYSMSVGTFCVFIIAAYVRQHKHVLAPMMDKLGDDLAAVVREKLST